MSDPGLKKFLEQNLKHELTPWPLASWDLPLLAWAAFYYNPELQVARAQWQAAHAATVTAGARPNPNLSASAEYNTDAAASVSPWTWSLGVELPFETAGKREHRLTHAQQLAEVARQQLASAAWDTRSRLRVDLVTAFGARERQDILERQLKLQEDYVDWLERRQVIGVVSAFETTQARLALDRARLALQQVRRQAAEAQVAVAAVLGVPSDALRDIRLSLDVFGYPPFPAAAVSGELRRQALQSRPDILGALATYAAAESALALEVAKQYPDLRLGPGFTWDQGDRKWTLGIGLVLPVFQNNQGPIAEAEARRAEAEARFIALQAKVINEIERANTSYRLTLNELETAEAVRAAARRRLQLLRGRLKGGEAQQAYLLNTQLEVESAELARVDALVKAQEAFGALEDAVHRPLDPLELAPSTADALLNSLNRGGS